MTPRFRKWIGGALVCGLALLGLVRSTRAQESGNPLPGGNQSTACVPAALGAPEDPDGDLRARLERLEKQREELMQALRNATAPVSTDAAPASPPASTDDVRNIVVTYLAEKDAEKKQAAAANSAESPDGYKVGSLLGASASFNQWGELWITTPNDDFTMHPGLFLSYDNVFWDQSPQLVKAPGARPGPKQGVASGVAANGIGDLEDGTYFRRIRPQLEGTLWDTFAYRFSLSLENIQFSAVGLDEFWVGAKKIPVIGEVRLGHVRDCLGLEGDMSSSSRIGTFLERSSYAEAILLNENYVTGAWFSNNFLDEHMTYSATVFRQDQDTFSGAFFGDGQFGAQGRLTFLPLYECEGRHLLHLGVSFGWRNGTNNLATSPDRVFELRARPEMRDDVPAGSPSGTQLVPNGNSNRMLDTGPIAAENDYILGLELCYVRGPFSVQSEWGWNFLDGAYGVAPSGFKLNPPIIPRQDYTFWGGYIQLAYTLTGEARGYDPRYGTLSRNYFGGPGVFSNAWLVRGEDGRLNWGLGAWEIAARYSFVDLNDGSGLQRIQGGKMDGFSVNLNWYLNNEFKIQFGWVYNHRYDVPEGTFSGYTSGFGTRVQLVF